MRAPRSITAIALKPAGSGTGASSGQSLEEPGFARLSGVVRRYDDMQGFGFITPDDGGPDVFAHVSEIASGGGEPSLVKGQRVTYGMVTGPEGIQARIVMPLT